MCDDAQLCEICSTDMWSIVVARAVGWLKGSLFSLSALLVGHVQSGQVRLHLTVYMCTKCVLLDVE